MIFASGMERDRNTTIPAKHFAKLQHTSWKWDCAKVWQQTNQPKQNMIHADSGWATFISNNTKGNHMIWTHHHFIICVKFDHVNRKSVWHALRNQQWILPNCPHKVKFYMYPSGVCGEYSKFKRWESDGAKISIKVVTEGKSEEWTFCNKFLQMDRFLSVMLLDFQTQDHLCLFRHPPRRLLWVCVPPLDPGFISYFPVFKDADGCLPIWFVNIIWWVFVMNMRIPSHFQETRPSPRGISQQVLCRTRGNPTNRRREEGATALEAGLWHNDFWTWFLTIELTYNIL